ncbi:NAD(P)H-binding protein [Apilactobacillus apisilvae]|uniref:NAD(P)H-binding protein n=1 Tax=Apilactobacillus apisilvae TaxID=2923364 RepID=A0ABY4PGR1_9LACO|nr:NAD(P)H-binding protein [Apilactobacillus apisilvae]UQS84699.1 NAD(P)H-binding protein [Apilactobacillus apisilvae]
MKNILVLGATGSLGSLITDDLKNNSNYHLTLFARSIKSNDQADVINGDVLNDADLNKATKNQDVIFAALSGNIESMAKKIVQFSEKNHVKKLIFISSMGIYDEIPASVRSDGNLSKNPFLQGYRNAADVIEDSNLNYTLIRPVWFDGGSDDYEITKKGEPFGGHNVSRQAIINLVKSLIDDENLYIKQSVGINRP